MKLRVGYISNSSSASFVLLGREVGNIYDNDLVLDFKHKTYVIFGKFLYEGIDYIRLNKEIFDWLNKHKYEIKLNDGLIIEELDIDEDCIKIPDGITDAKVWNIKIDQSSSESIHDLQLNYIKN